MNVCNTQQLRAVFIHRLKWRSKLFAGFRPNCFCVCFVTIVSAKIGLAGQKFVGHLVHVLLCLGYACNTLHSNRSSSEVRPLMYAKLRSE
jgi:hypothetical protein